MTTTTYLVALPEWAVPVLVTWDYGKGIYQGLTGEQSKQLNKWLETIDPDGYGFICHEPEEGDQKNTPIIPAFGGLAPAVMCYITIYHD